MASNREGYLPPTTLSTSCYLSLIFAEELSDCKYVCVCVCVCGGREGWLSHTWMVYAHINLTSAIGNVCHATFENVNLNIGNYAPLGV